MILTLLFSLATASPDACAPAAVQPALRSAIAAFQAKQVEQARAALTPVQGCPVRDGATYLIHLLRAQIAGGAGDWATARAMLAGMGVQPQHPLSALAGMVRLRTDQGLGDAAAFTADRDALLAANARGLAAAGRAIERFRVAGGQVEAFETPVDQGSFHRVYEFVATPDDPAAYPATIMLTDDRTAVQVADQLARPGAPKPQHLWFVDLYTCGGHQTLGPVPDMTAATAPAYAEVKAKVVATLADPKVLAAAPPPKEICVGPNWLLPGLGLRAAAPG